MSRTAIIVVLLIAALLSVAAVFALKPGRGAVVSGPLLSGFDVGGVQKLEIGASAGTGTAVTIALDERAAGVWIMRWRDAGGVERAWPASGSRVRGAIRLLGDLRSDPAAAGGAADGGTRVVLHGAGGEKRVLMLAAGGVAGKTRVRVEGDVKESAALAESALLEVFQAAGIEAWREPSIFGTEITDASRLTVGAPGREIVVSRVGRSWGMQSPLVERADEPLVTTVLNALASVAVRTFVGRATPESEQAFSGPTTRIVVESTRRRAGGEGGAGAPERWSVVQTVTIGSAAGVGGATLFAKLEATIDDPRAGTSAVLWGPVIVTLDRDAINGVPADPAAYVSRVASRMVGADVLSISVANAPTEPGVQPASGAVWTREADGWRERGAVVNDVKSNERMEWVLALATRERAAQVMLDTKTEFVPKTVLRLAGVAGQPEERIDVGVIAGDVGAGGDAKKRRVVMRSGAVFRVFTGELAGKLAPYLLRD